MTTNPRQITATGRGGAKYVFAHHEPAEWLVASIPGAVEAREAWHAENAKGAELYREFRASGEALVKLRQSDPLASELEAAERTHKERGKAVDAQAKRSLAALRRFDALAYSGDGTPDEYRAAAAEHALKKHAEAVAAWHALKAAIEERDAAHRSAGSPGRDWRHSAIVNYRSLGNVETVVRPMLEGFDPGALKLAAEGQRVPSAAEQAAAALEAAKEADAKAAASVKHRTAKEAY